MDSQTEHKHYLHKWNTRKQRNDYMLLQYHLYRIQKQGKKLIYNAKSKTRGCYQFGQDCYNREHDNSIFTY